EPADPNATAEEIPAGQPEPDLASEPEAVSEPHPASEPEAASPETASEPEPAWESEAEVETDDHQSLSMTASPEFDAKAARPRVVLHFHLAEAALRTGQAIVRPEDGDPITLDQLVEFLGRTRCQVRIQPVLNPTEVAAVDGYEIPAQLRAAVRALQVADVFPFGTCLSQNMDLDHTERYLPTDYGGPPGQNPARQPRSDCPSRASSCHPRRMDQTPARTGLLHTPLTHRVCLPGHQPRHPRPRPHQLQQCRLASLKTETSRHPRLAVSVHPAHGGW
ncbi:MAG TPA: hypothetical protein VJ820_08025, partial [Propionibacteriaceae bacterium]|nr:hypothetical protein [Propionibacteriaceae bacterium]